MFTRLLMCMALITIIPSMAKESRTISLIEKSPDVKTIRESLNDKTETVRTVYSKDKNYLVLAHDRASGVMKEDIYLYKHKDDAWFLIGIVIASKQACFSVENKGSSVKLLNFKGELIAQFEQNQ